MTHYSKEILKTIRTDRRLALERKLHNKYDSVRLSPSQEMFALTDQHILEIHQMTDEITPPITKNTLL